jgi:hypothetical protein
MRPALAEEIIMRPSSIDAETAGFAHIRRVRFRFA